MGTTAAAGGVVSTPSEGSDEQAAVPGVVRSPRPLTRRGRDVNAPEIEPVAPSAGLRVAVSQDLQAWGAWNVAVTAGCVVVAAAAGVGLAGAVWWFFSTGGSHPATQFPGEFRGPVPAWDWGRYALCGCAAGVIVLSVYTYRRLRSLVWAVLVLVLGAAFVWMSAVQLNDQISQIRVYDGMHRAKALPVGAGTAGA